MVDINTQTLSFELVSPERKLISEQVRMVVIPGEEGDFGVLPNHSSLISTIRTGVLEVHGKDENAAPRRIFIAGGFADVSAMNCTVLAEDAVDVADLDEAALEKEIKNLTEDLDLASGDEALAEVHRRLSLAKARLSAVRNELIAA